MGKPGGIPRRLGDPSEGFKKVLAGPSLEALLRGRAKRGRETMESIQEVLDVQ